MIHLHNSILQQNVDHYLRWTQKCRRKCTVLYNVYRRCRVLQRALKRSETRYSRYLLLMSTPRHIDHSLGSIFLSLSISQYSSNVLAQVFGFTSFLIIFFRERISVRRSFSSLSLSKTPNFHSMIRFSIVSLSDSSVITPAVVRRREHQNKQTNKHIHIRTYHMRIEHPTVDREDCQT